MDRLCGNVTGIETPPNADRPRVGVPAPTSGAVDHERTRPARERAGGCPGRSATRHTTGLMRGRSRGEVTHRGDLVREVLVSTYLDSRYVSGSWQICYRPALLWLTLASRMDIYVVATEIAASTGFRPACRSAGGVYRTARSVVSVTGEFGQRAAKVSWRPAGPVNALFTAGSCHQIGPNLRIRRPEVVRDPWQFLEPAVWDQGGQLPQRP